MSSGWLDGCCVDLRTELSFYTVPGFNIIGQVLGNLVPSRVSVRKSAVESLVR